MKKLTINSPHISSIYFINNVLLNHIINFLIYLKLRTLGIFIVVIVLQGCQTIKLNNNSIQHQNLNIKKFTGIQQFNNYLDNINQLRKSRTSLINTYKKNECLKNNKDINSTHDCLYPVVIVGSRIIMDSITNNQILNVDEGDIIKHYKNLLIVLRKGKLYSIDIGNKESPQLTPKDSINAYSPYWKHEAWFDEILIDNGMLIVLGYNYQNESSEIIRFKLSEQGHFSFIDNYLIKSNDYFDERDYASRLVNHQFQISIQINLDTSVQIEEQLPKITKVPNDFDGDLNSLNWKSMISVTEIYTSAQDILNPTIYSYITCPINFDKLNCQGIGIISSDDTVDFNDGKNIYLWTPSWYKPLDEISQYTIAIENNIQKQSIFPYHPIIFRISQKDLNVTAAQTQGRPLSTFSFHHKKNNLYMYAALTENSANLINIPDYYFNTDASHMGISLKTINNIQARTLNHKFSDKYFIFGNRYWDTDETLFLKTTNIYNGATNSVDIGHSIDRIETIKNQVLVAGLTPDNNQGISLVPLNDLTNYQQTTLYDRIEGESRSHAFNYNYIDDFLVAGITTYSKDILEYDDDEYWQPITKA